MVESLAPVWAEEAARCGPGGIPDAPPSPPRSPRPLCPAVDYVRQQFAALAEEQERQLQREEAEQTAAAAGGAPSPAAAAAAASGEAPAATPAAAVMPTQAPAGTPLLAMTQAANRAVLPPRADLEAPSSAQQRAASSRRGWLPGRLAAAAGDQTPATPAGVTQPQLGGPAGAGTGALLDEALLLTQLTEAQQRRQQQALQQAWGPSQQVPAQGGGVPPGSQQAPRMDADAWAWLQARGRCIARMHGRAACGCPVTLSA